MLTRHQLIRKREILENKCDSPHGSVSTYEQELTEIEEQLARHDTTHVRTYTGARVDLLAPDVGDIHIEDITAHLAGLRRFCGTGATVLQHSLWMADTMRIYGRAPVICLAALFHDAHEAYLADIPTPVKRLLGKAWSDIETRVQHAIEVRFGITVKPGDRNVVRVYDSEAMNNELYISDNVENSQERFVSLAVELGATL